MAEIKFGQLPMSFHNFNRNSGCNDITLSVTEECNLRCKYCYLVHKNNFKKMSFETAKSVIDYILSARDLYNEASVVWNFIGGEPLLEIELIDKISDYIKKQMYLTNHPWFDNFMFCIGTNGILYHTEKVQKYIEKNKEHLSVTISVDGNKVKHDLQRVYPDGRGSYNDVIKNVPLWLSQFPGAMTKATFSKEDLPYLKDSIIHLWNLGIKKIPANIIFEDVWEDGDAQIFEAQLRELADYVIDNNIFMDPQYSVQFFNPTLGLPLVPEDKKHKFCGSGKMLAVDCDGKFYPCIRFTDFSMSKKKKGLSIGNVSVGVIKDKLKPFEHLSIEKMNHDKCQDCEVASGCRACVGFCYDESADGSIFQRTTYHCEMQKANVRAVDYFWNKVSSKLRDDENPRKIAKKNYKQRFGKYLIIYTSDFAPSHCFYNNEKSEESSVNNYMDEKVLQHSVKFAQSNTMFPVVIGNSPMFEGENFFYVNDYFPVNYKNKNKMLIVNESNLKDKFSTDVCILRTTKKMLPNLSKHVKSIFENKKSIRVNILLTEIKDLSENDKLIYKNQLDDLVDFIFNNLDKNYSINIFDDLSSVENINNCDCGIDTFSVMPNGKLYLCPGMYFFDKSLSIGNIQDGFNISSKTLEIFKEKFRCIYINKTLTGEYNVEPDCVIDVELIEKAARQKLKTLIDTQKQYEEASVMNL